MKKYFFIAFLLSSTFFYGQFSLNRPPVILNPGDKPTKEYTIGAYSFGCWYLYTGLEAGLLRKKSAYFAGIGVQLNYEDGSPFKNYGLNLDYNYFPNGYNHRFDLYFSANLNFGFPYYEYKTYDANHVYIKTEKGIEDVQSYGAGFGFNTNFSQRLFLKFNIGLGLFVYHFQFIDDSSLRGNLKLSFGYRL